MKGLDLLGFEDMMRRERYTQNNLPMSQTPSGVSGEITRLVGSFTRRSAVALVAHCISCLTLSLAFYLFAVRPWVGVVVVKLALRAHELIETFASRS